MDLKAQLTAYNDLLVRKEELAAAVKENNAAIEAARLAVAQQMVDDDVPQMTIETPAGAYSFRLSVKTIYNKRSEAELAEGGVSFTDTLREEGLGYLVQETVNSRSLQSALANYVEEEGALSEGLKSVVRAYELTDVNRRRAEQYEASTQPSNFQEVKQLWQRTTN